MWSSKTIGKCKQRLVTNDGEICHHVNTIVVRDGYSDALVVRKRVLTNRVDEYILAGFSLLRTFRDYSVVQQYFSVKIETLHYLLDFVNKAYNEQEKAQRHPCTTCDGYEESACCGALIIKHDICSDCGEHCESKCEDCEFKFE